MDIGGPTIRLGDSLDGFFLLAVSSKGRAGESACERQDAGDSQDPRRAWMVPTDASRAGKLREPSTRSLGGPAVELDGWSS